MRWDGRPAAGVTAVFATILSVVGFEILSLGLHTKTYSWTRRFDRHNRSLERFYRRFNLETGLLLGGALLLLGGGASWPASSLNGSAAMLPLPRPEWASLGATLFIIGAARCSRPCSSPPCR